MKNARHVAIKVVEVDKRVTHQAARHRDTPVMKAIETISEVGDQPPLIALSVATCVLGLALRRPDLARGGARMLCAHLLATGAKLAIKHQFDRTRPTQAIEHGGHRFRVGDEGDHDHKSFPSGHTAGAVAVARAAARDIDGAAVPAGLAAAAIAAAQPAIGHHYLTDVAVGAAVGWASEAIVSALFDRFEPKLEAALSPAA